MLGKVREDPLFIEGENKSEEGFKFLNTKTSFIKENIDMEKVEEIINI